MGAGMSQGGEKGGRRAKNAKERLDFAQEVALWGKNGSAGGLGWEDKN
jgi:hypothetical protein